MAEDEWQLEAVHEQFNVFDSLTQPVKRIPLHDLHCLMIEVERVKRSHMKMNKMSTGTPNSRVLSAEIIKHTDGDEINFSFIVIITNVETDRGLCKMPVFVLISGGKRVFVDMNATLFTSWNAFILNNNLPPCQFCFPVDGQYCIGRKLKIDFAKSPAAMRQNVNIMWKSCGFVVAVGIVVGSFFFKLPDFNHSQADSLLGIANTFVPGLQKYGGLVLTGVTIVSQLRRGDKSLIHGLSDLWKFLLRINVEFKDEISNISDKIRSVLRKIYDWIKEKFSYFYEKASKWAQDMFIAVVSKVDSDINAAQSDAVEIIEASLRNNHRQQAVFVATAIHAENTHVNDPRYARDIFASAQNESVFHNGMAKKVNENLNPRTLDLLEMSTSIAEKLDKTTLKDVQDTFEAISTIIREEYTKKVKVYSKMLEAAKAGAGRAIDIGVFNQTLGIKGSPEVHYWQEAMASVQNELRLAYRLHNKIDSLTGQKKILILPLTKPNENSIQGLYNLMGVNGAGKITAIQLVKALKEINFKLSKDLMIHETSSMIVIRTETLTISAYQELNEDRTSQGVLMVVKTEA